MLRRFFVLSLTVIPSIVSWASAAEIVTPQTPPSATKDANTPEPAKPSPSDAKKHTILFFTARWCPSCVRMKSETLPNVRTPGHDLQIIDVDQNAQLMQSYGVQSIPTYIVLDGSGKAYRQGVGYRDVAQFVAFLNAR